MSDHILPLGPVDLSASATSAVPIWVAPYSGYVEKLFYTTRNAPLADAGSTTVGDIELRVKNERSGSYLHAIRDWVGTTALSAVSVAITDAAVAEFRKGDIFTLNQRVSALSAATGPGHTLVTMHVRTNRYGGQITQSFEPQE